MKQPLPSPSTAGLRKEEAGASRVVRNLQPVITTMIKTMDLIADTVRNPKPPFRKSEHQPKKALKHRYERRKIKEFLHLGEWRTEEAV